MFLLTTGRDIPQSISSSPGSLGPRGGGSGTAGSPYARARSNTSSCGTTSLEQTSKSVGTSERSGLWPAVLPIGVACIAVVSAMAGMVAHDGVHHLARSRQDTDPDLQQPAPYGRFGMWCHGVGRRQCERATGHAPCQGSPADGGPVVLDHLNHHTGRH